MKDGLNIQLRTPRAQRREDREDREWVANLLAEYARSIDYGLGAYAAGSDNEKGYLLDKLASLTDAINYYL